MVIEKYTTIPTGDYNFSAQNQKNGGLQKTDGDFWKKEVRSIKRKRRKREHHLNEAFDGVVVCT